MVAVAIILNWTLILDARAMTHQFKVELLVTAAFLAPLPAIAAGDVTSEIHELCLKAVDYRGCVATQKGTPESVGNKCPTGYAFIGGGTCQKVDCVYAWWGERGSRGYKWWGQKSFDRKHDPLIAGKSSWKCPNKFSWGTIRTGVMRLGVSSPVSHSEICPSVEPRIGWNNSCEHAKPGWKDTDFKPMRP